MLFVYVLKSVKDNNLYIGQTNNLQRRISGHNNGNVQSTKKRRPLILLGFTKCYSKEEVILTEKEYKKGYKREKIKRKYNLI